MHLSAGEEAGCWANKPGPSCHPEELSLQEENELLRGMIYHAHSSQLCPQDLWGTRCSLCVMWELSLLRSGHETAEITNLGKRQSRLTASFLEKQDEKGQKGISHTSVSEGARSRSYPWPVLKEQPGCLVPLTVGQEVGSAHLRRMGKVFVKSG